MENINKCDISGTITGIKQSESKTLVKLSQKVADQFESNFTVLLAYSDAEVKEGDEILILSATVYEKNGAMRFRIGSKEQLIILKKNPDLGILDAKDKFI